jgi:hypothetical protein
MSQQKPASQVDVPDIEKCPNCGHVVFLGEIECSQCGHPVGSLERRIRLLNPIPIAAILVIVGLIVSAAAIGADPLPQLILLLMGMGLIVSGGLVVAADILLNDPFRKRK